MNASDTKLLEGLRTMAADGPREAPAAVEERLLGELRRRNRARRRNMRLAMGTGAIAAAIAVLLWIRPAAPAPATSVARQEIPAAPVAALPALATSTSAPAQPKAARVKRSHRRGAEVALNFYRLPDTEELPPVDSATIVRVQLPMSSLRLMGWQVSEDQAAQPIQADVLLGQDGLARGVRFVQ